MKRGGVPIEKYIILIKGFLEEYHQYHCIKLSKYWILFGDEDEIPNKGVKIHISSNEYNYFETLKSIVPILHKYDFIWKIPNSNNVAKYIMKDEEELDINGKLITVYSRDFCEFKKALRVLENQKVLNKDCINVTTDTRYKTTCIFYRRYSDCIN